MIRLVVASEQRLPNGGKVDANSQNPSCTLARSPREEVEIGLQLSAVSRARVPVVEKRSPVT
jgi:hypothetical protein